MKPHKHAELIKAWADGAIIERRITLSYDWTQEDDPDWSESIEYRIKPEPKPDVVKYADACTYGVYGALSVKPNLKLTFDGETGELKSAEVLK